MSAPVFVKVTMSVLFQDLTSADYYRELADEIDVSDDEDDPRCVAEDSPSQQKQWFLERANELEREDMPNVDELYEFLSSCDTDKPRFLEMIEDANCYRPYRSAKIYIEGERVKISYVTTAEPDHFGYESPEDMERFINQDPFFKSRTGGHVGNYCKFPSRDFPEDQLGELEMVADVVRITEGGDAWEEPESDEEEEATHPFFNEELFGEPEGLSLDEEQEAPRAPSWSKKYVPRPIRRVFKALRF